MPTVSHELPQAGEFRDFGGVKMGFNHPRWECAMDGVTDDSAGMQAAINYVEAQGGGELYLPPHSSFAVASPLILPRSATVDIIGCGQHSRIINTSLTATPALRLSDSATNVSSFYRLQDFRIDINAGGCGILLNNSRAETAITGTVAVTNGSKVVTGTGTAFTTDIDRTRDSVEIDGVLYDIRFIASNTTLELTTNYPGITASGLTADRVRFGNGSRWNNVSSVWIQGPAGGPVSGTYGIQAERINNVKFEGVILIRGLATGFRALALNGRSSGSEMDMVIVANATEVSFDFNDCRSFKMIRCRSEGNVPVAFLLDTCDAFNLDFCTAEDDHAEAGFRLIDCNRIHAFQSGVGTNFGGGVGWDLQNTDLSTFWGGQVAYQVLRAEDFPTTPDVVKAGIKIDAASQGNRFIRTTLENGSAAIDNQSTTSAVAGWLNWDTNSPELTADAIPRLTKIKTNAGAAITAATTLSRFDGGAVRLNADGGAFAVTLPNATADNIGLEFMFIVEGSLDNAIAVNRAGTDTIDYTGSTLSGTTFSIRRGNVVGVLCTELGKWQFTRRFGNRIQGVASGTGTTKMNSTNNANNAGWIEIQPGRWIPYWSTPAP